MRRPSHFFTPEQVEYIAVMCRVYLDKNLVHLFNRRFDTQLIARQITTARKNRGITTGRCTRFKAGQPFNPNSGAKGPNKTSFKVGNKPANWVPVGSERIATAGLTEIKIQDSPPKWRSKHALLWEKHHGKPVPKGHIVRFADGDNRNFTISNLLLVSRREHALFNVRGYNDAPSEIKPTLLRITKLDASINKKLQETNS